ncbi:hypothetical protein [Mycobacterium avium]|uniref:hypothetical protein n=1 Tax=Mycobacterium avium TaxID=1764 RepID=UPI0003D22078|nr:hypothetical protein [Mycobacterium avium]ETB31477.1 hypothetical protein O971_05855 [Mycobacterium avium subsp. hominissuis 10-4249]KDO94871.1 hypothetical protein MAVA5_15370 [Mycobacterium avium subsp. hominissuis A5]
MTSSIAPPADARRVYPWEFDGVGWSRWFDGSACTTGPAMMTMTGRQYDDGTVLRGVSVRLGDDELLDADEARLLAAVLLEAAGELGRLR